jgi:hypothetical protein
MAFIEKFNKIFTCAEVKKTMNFKDSFETQLRLKFVYIMNGKTHQSPKKNGSHCSSVVKCEKITEK